MTAFRLFLDSLGVLLVECMQEAMEVSLRGDKYDLHHIVSFSAMVLGLGFAIMYFVERFYGAHRVQKDRRKARELAKRGEEDGDGARKSLINFRLWSQFRTFTLLLVARTCAYLGGYAIQMTACQWIAQHHAETILGESEMENEKLNESREHQNSAPNLPQLPHITPHGKQVVDAEVALEHAKEAAEHTAEGVKQSLVSVTEQAKVVLSRVTRHSFLSSPEARDGAEEEGEEEFDLGLTLKFALWALTVSLLAVAVIWVGRHFVARFMLNNPKDTKTRRRKISSNSVFPWHPAPF